MYNRFLPARNTKRKMPIKEHIVTHTFEFFQLSINSADKNCCSIFPANLSRTGSLWAAFHAFLQKLTAI